MFACHSLKADEEMVPLARKTARKNGPEKWSAVGKRWAKPISFLTNRRTDWGQMVNSLSLPLNIPDRTSSARWHYRQLS
jgi:hypothetical protein